MEKWTIINKDKTKCALCSETRILERAHIIPKRFTKGLRLSTEETEYHNNVILLCPTHHSLFDLDRLNEEEKAVLKPLVAESVSFLEHFNENVYLVVKDNVKDSTPAHRNMVSEATQYGESTLLRLKEKVAKFVERKREVYELSYGN